MYKIKHYLSEVETNDLKQAKEFAMLRLEFAINVKDKVKYGNENLFTGFQITQEEYENYIKGE